MHILHIPQINANRLCSEGYRHHFKLYERLFISSIWQAICLFQRIEMLLVCIFVAVEGVMPELRVPLIADIGVGANWLEAH